MIRAGTNACAGRGYSRSRSTCSLPQPVAKPGLPPLARNYRQPHLASLMETSNSRCSRLMGEASPTGFEPVSPT